MSKKNLISSKKQLYTIIIKSLILSACFGVFFLGGGERGGCYKLETVMEQTRTIECRVPKFGVGGAEETNLSVHNFRIFFKIEIF